jgi:hypothetical protein
MDYTKIPAALIYRQRQSLDEFIDSNNLIAALVDNMFEIDYLNKNDFERSAKDGLNAAFYICTIIMLEKRPEWRWTFYLNEADYNHETAWDIYDGQEFVMALVYVLLRRFNKEWSAAHQPLMKRLFEYNFPNYRFDDNPGERAHLEFKHKIIRKLVHKLPAGNLPDDIFAPCDINDDAIEEAEMDMAQANMGWQELTNDFNSQAINELIEAVCKNDVERALLAKAIMDGADSMQMGYRVDFLRQPLPTTNNTADSLDKSAQLLARIKELEAENEQLKERNKELEKIKAIMDTPLDGIEADSKVGLTLIMKLMMNDGANFEKSKNKTVAAKALKMMTGRSESACKQIFSTPLSPTYPRHQNKIAELNGYLKALGMKTLLP